MNAHLKAEFTNHYPGLFAIRGQFHPIPNPYIPPFLRQDYKMELRTEKIAKFHMTYRTVKSEIVFLGGILSLLLLYLVLN